MVIVLVIFGLLMFGLCIFLIRKGNKMEKEAETDEYVYIEEEYKEPVACEEEPCEECSLDGIDKPIPEKKLKQWR